MPKTAARPAPAPATAPPPQTTFQPLPQQRQQSRPPPPPPLEAPSGTSIVASDPCHSAGQCHAMLQPLPLRRAMRHRLPSDFLADSGPQWFPSGFPVCPSAFPVVSQWLPSRFPVASQWLPDGFPVASQWLPGGFPVASQSLEIRCTHCSSGRSGGRFAKSFSAMAPTSPLKRGSAAAPADNAATPARRPCLSPESKDGTAAAAAASAVPLVPAQGNVTVVEEPVCDDASTASCMQGVVPAVSQLLRQLGNHHRWTSKGMVRAVLGLPSQPN